jgi:hypothetical protein
MKASVENLFNVGDYINVEIILFIYLVGINGKRPSYS